MIPTAGSDTAVTLLLHAVLLHVDDKRIDPPITQSNDADDAAVPDVDDDADAASRLAEYVDDALCTLAPLARSNETPTLPNKLNLSEKTSEP